ncbi:MAG: permease [Treponema sp.]|nr:permease [Treponema sp.]
MDKQWIIAAIQFFFWTCRDMLSGFFPYFLAGIFLGELIKFASWTKLIYKWISKSPVLAVISASIIGILSPLCTYGTIPIVIELYKSQEPRSGTVRASPLITFCAASSLMNPQLFVMTAGGIGLEMAIVRTLAVFTFSFAAGMLTLIIPDRFMIRKNIKVYEDGGGKIETRKKKKFAVKQYFINCVKSFLYIAPFLLIGVFLGAAVTVFVPQRFFYEALYMGRVQSILAGAILGIPMNACGGGAIPFVQTLLALGLGKGAALAFFLVGPALRPAPLAAMSALFTPLMLIGYAVFLIISAVFMGLVYV